MHHGRERRHREQKKEGQDPDESTFPDAVARGKGLGVTSLYRKAAGTVTQSFARAGKML
jgi:hypothetical protein